MIIEALVGLLIITSLVYFIFVRLAEKKKRNLRNENGESSIVLI